MKQSLKYYFSFYLLLSLFFAQAQQKTTTTSIQQDVKIIETKSLTPIKKSSEKKLETLKTDTIKPKTDRYGLILGVDIYRATRSFYDSNYKGIAFVGDYRLTKKYYLYGEIGNENITI